MQRPLIRRATTRTATAASTAVAVVAVALGLAACGPERSYDNPPEVPIGTVSTSTSTTSTTSTTIFVPTTAPTTVPPPTNPPPPTAPPTFAPQTAPPTQPTVPVSTTGEVYTVERGDTLFGIANKLGVDINSLLAANGLQQNSLIVPGQRLGVPQGGALPATTAAPPPTQPPAPTVPPTPPPTQPPAPPTQPPAPPPTTGDRYTVVAGDTLSGIARKLGVDLGQLMAANGLNENSVIRPGQQLVVPQGGAPPAQATTQPPPRPTAPPQQPPAQPGGPTTVTLPAPPNQVVPRQTAASCQAPDSQEADGTPIVFAPGNVLDRNPATAWRCEGSTQNISLTFDLDGPTRLTSVGLIGGYVKVDPLTEVDRFPQNRRVRQVRWTFDGGQTVTQDLADSRELQTIAVDVTTARVTMTVTATYPAGGELPRDFVPVAEVELLGG